MMPSESFRELTVWGVGLATSFGIWCALARNKRKIRREAFAPGEQIHPIADRRCVVRALAPSPSLLCGTRCRRVRLAEIREIRAHQPHIGRHAITESRVRDQRENHVHHVVGEAAAVEGGKAEGGGRVQFVRQDRWAEAREELRSVGRWVGR